MSPERGPVLTINSGRAFPTVIISIRLDVDKTEFGMDGTYARTHTHTYVKGIPETFNSIKISLFISLLD
jgi:hypothetical protein